MRWTIRAKLTGLVLAVLLPLVAAAAVKFWLEVEQAREDAQAGMLESAHTLAQLVDELLTGQIENLEALASVRAVDQIEDDDLIAAAARIKPHRGFIHRFLAVRADGGIVASSDPGGSVGPFPAVHALDVALRDRVPQVAPPQPSPSDGRFVVPLVIPVVDRGGAATGAMVAEIDLQGASDYLTRLPLNQGTSAAIVTTTGALIARSGVNAQSLGRPFPVPPGAEPLGPSRAGVTEWLWPDGVNRLTAVAPLTRAPWMALAAQPRDLAYAPATKGLQRNLIGLGAVMLAALGVAWLISRRMTRSVQSLIDGARGLAAGTSPRISVPTGDELAELAEQLNRSIDERRAAETAVDERQRRIRALADVNRAISQQLDLEPLLQQITDAVGQLTGADNAVLWEADPAGRTLTRRAWTTASSVGALGLPDVLTFEQGGTGWVARHREPLFVEDVAGDPRIMAADWALSRDLVGFAGAPVEAGGNLLGVLTLNLRRGKLPEGDERTLLSSFASQAAVAIDNARLFADVEARRRAAEALSELGHALAQALDPAVVAQRVADNVRALLGTGSSVLYRLDAESGDLVALAVSGDVGPGFRDGLVIPAGIGLVALAVRQRAPAMTTNLFADARIALSGDLRERVEGTGQRAALAVPLIVKDAVIGALTMGDRQGRVFHDDEIQIAQAFADQAALALDNARLYDEAQQRLRHLDSLRQVVEQILVPISLDERLTVIARKAAELFGADRATIALRAEGRDELVVRAGHSLAPGEVGRVLHLGSGVIGMVALRHTGILVNDYQNWAHRDPYIVAAHGDRPAEAVIGCPLLIRDQLIGAISVGIHTPGRRLVTDDLDRLASFAGPAALAIEHSRLYEDLHAHVKELESTQAQLLQAGKLSAVGQLVSGVAHELNNPLSVILGYAQLLAERNVSSDVRRPIDAILAQGGRMAKIVQSLLLFSRQRKAERGAVDVREAIEQPVSLRATQLLLSGVRLSATYGEGVPAAEGDAHQLQQVFLNLILNAEQAILGSGTGDRRVGDAIRVTTGMRVERDQTWVLVTVADNGPGIAPDVLPRIFEPFFTTKKVGEGTGLGLSVSYGIIQEHGGRLSVESEPSRTVFTIELPAAQGAAGTRAPDRPASGAECSGRGRRVLVVDDEPGVLDLVATLLQQAGWNVETASGGRIARERLRAADYDLVLADMRMPDGSGEDLYRDVAAWRGDLAARFLFMTGDTANPEAWKFLDATQAPVIEKPFTAQMLLSAVERVGT